MRAVVLVAGMMLGCNGPGSGDDEITFYGDIEPITQRVCANCHNGNGIGPGDFTTYEGIAPLAELVELYVSTGEMPPKVSDPECHEYAGGEQLTITDEERAMIVEWAANNAPMGDEGDALGEIEPYFERIEPDIELPLPYEYTLQPNESGNEYRCFVVDYVPEQDFSITAFDVLVDNAAVVHHLLLFRDPNGDAGAGYGAAGEASFDCMNPIMENDWEPLHAWAPGMPPTRLPDGHGLDISAGDQLVIQMHYYSPGDEPQTDQSGYALAITTGSVNEVMMYPGALTNFAVPAGDADYTYEESIGLDLPISINVHGVFPHMHLLGKSYEAKLEHADGSETCVVRGEWDFDHQMAYVFDEPVTIRPGDTLVGSCTWDNSEDNPNQQFDPPQTMYWGEGTDEEMCVFLTYASLAGL